MPSFIDNEKLPDSTGTENAGNEEDKESDTNNDSAGNEKGEKPSSSEPKTLEEISKEFGEKEKKLIEGWREDRLEAERLRNENRLMRERLSKQKEAEDDDEEYEGLSDEERINRKMAKREAEKKAREEEELEAIKRDIRFHERTDPVFKANKEQILAIAEKINAINLEQAIKVFNEISQVVKNTKSEMKLREKPKPKLAPKKKYDRKADENKSFGDMFREGGIP